MTRLRHLVAHALLAIAEAIDTTPEPWSPEDEDDEWVNWAELAILHAELAHGCEHTEQARAELGMPGRGVPA